MSIGSFWRGLSVSWVMLMTLGLFACKTPPETPSGPSPELAPDVVATFEGGQLSLARIEAFLRPQASENDSTVSDWDQRYEEAARLLAIEDILRGKAEDVQAAIETELGRAFPRLACDATLDLYLQQNPIEIVPITQEQVGTFHQEHSRIFERPEQRMVWHLFLRHSDPKNPEATLARLAELRHRALSGESFRQLAESHSMSENRGRRGHLGWMTLGGQMPADLEKVIFAIEAGGVSEPLPTPDGGILLYVSDVLPGVSMGLEDARPLIVGRLRELAFQKVLAEQVAEISAWDGDFVLSDEELQPKLLQSGPDDEILRLGDVSFSFVELQELIPPRAPMGSFELVSPFDRLIEAYRVQTHRHLLCRKIDQQSLLVTQEDRTERDQRIRAMGEAKLVEQRLDDKIWQHMEADPELLRRFYDDNQHLFQSPLQMLIEGLTVPLGEHPVRHMQDLEKLREDLIAGRQTFQQGLQLPGAQLIPQQWVGPGALATLEPKILVYLTQLGGTGYTVPFQQNQMLQLLRVVERKEPAPLGFEVAERQVGESYYQRHQQELYQEVVEVLLEETEFEFRPEVVERHLAGFGLGSS